MKLISAIASSRSDCLDCQEVIQKNSSSCRKTQNLKPEKSAAIASLVGWVERNNTGSKIAQVACLSETQPP
ncbi:hypothetical protein [Microcystis aeruginosa]|uniref:hypothetical protein n=1 Tax=Microcystis aeruginosa TaxID=1126 RepID=UPI001330C43B|nr:hypothetical protein [Microcystis aeruginosa]